MNFGFFWQQHWKKILIIIILLILIPIGSLFIINILKSSTVLIYITPVDASITIDGQQYQNGTYKMFPGNKEVTISRDNFDTKTFTIDFQANQVTNIMTFLHPSNGNFSFYRDTQNLASFNVLQQLTGYAISNIPNINGNITIDNDRSANTFMKECEKIISIKQYLPVKGWVSNEQNKYDSGSFTIEDGSNYDECSSAFCLGVKYYYKKFPDQVAEKIQSLGYNPANYQIIYKKAN